MHAPKNRNSLGNLLEPFAVGLQSWANICIIDYICLYYSHFLVHWQAPKGSFPLNPHFGRPGSPGTATEEPKSPLWWPTSMVTSTPCERTWWWSLWLDGHCPTWVVSWYLHTLDTWIVFCFLDELSLNSRARYATLSWFMLKLSSKKTGAVRWQHVKYGLAHADVPLWQGFFYHNKSFSIPSQRFKVHKATHSRHSMAHFPLAVHTWPRWDLTDAWETWLS